MQMFDLLKQFFELISMLCEKIFFNQDHFKKACIAIEFNNLALRWKICFTSVPKEAAIIINLLTTW